MPCTRRDFLKSGSFGIAAAALGPNVFLRSLGAAQGGPPRNLILVELMGGNDGLNTIVPHGLDGGVYYDEYRQSLAVPAGQVLQVPGTGLGFHPALPELKAHFDAGRLAVVQGVTYPDPSFSHDYSQQIWLSGMPGTPLQEGWFARYLNLYPAPPFPAALEVFERLTLLTQGTDGFMPAADSLDDFAFPSDGAHEEDAANRKNTYAAIASASAPEGGTLGTIASTSNGLVQLIDTFATVPTVTYAGVYPNNRFGRALRLTVRLLAANLGMRFFHVGYGGFDTHDDQDQNNFHANLLTTLSRGLDAFYADLQALNLADDTLVVVFSEFGRTVYQNGSRGTDHGSVNPVLVFGNGVVGGFATAHPSLDPANLTSDGEPPMVVDFRDVFGTVLLRWLGESSGNLSTIFPGYGVSDLGFIA